MADDGADDGGAVSAVAVVDMLDHLLPALMLEIHIDVGRLVAAGGDEALEQQIMLRGIDGGDAKDLANGGIGRRAPALAENALRARKTDDLVDGEEVRRVGQLLDQL